MAFITIEDLYGTIEVVVFPRDYSRFKHLIIKDNKVLIKGNASITEEEGKLLLSEMYSFDEIKLDMEAENKELWICFEDEASYNENEQRFLNILGEHPGRTQVMVMLKNPRAMKRMGNRYKVLANQAILDRLQREWGTENVLIREKKQ